VARFVADPAFMASAVRRVDARKPGLSACWKALASASPDAFLGAQRALGPHFDPLVRKIEAEEGLNVTLRSHTLQDVIWSTAVPQRDVAMELPARSPRRSPVDGLHHQARKHKERKSRTLQKQTSVLAHNQLL
jgi:hypothetical protein